MTHAFDVAQKSIETAITHLTALEERLSRIEPVIVNHRDLTGMTSRALRLIEDAARLMAQIDSSIRYCEAGGSASLKAADNFARESYEVTAPAEAEVECGCSDNPLSDLLLSLLKARQQVAPEGVSVTNVVNCDASAPKQATDSIAQKLMDDALARAGVEPIEDQVGEQTMMSADDPDLPPEVAALIGALKAQGIEVTHAVRLH